MIPAAELQAAPPLVVSRVPGQTVMIRGVAVTVARVIGPHVVLAVPSEDADAVSLPDEDWMTDDG